MRCCLPLSVLLTCLLAGCSDNASTDQPASEPPDSSASDSGKPEGSSPDAPDTATSDVSSKDSGSKDTGADAQLDRAPDTSQDAVLDSPVDSALPPALSAAILAPTGPDSLVTSESLTLQGSASGGNPPYSFQWKSDIDGVFGATQDLTVSTLSVADHMIHLEVVDSSSTLASSPGLSIHVLPSQFDWSHKVLPSAAPAPGDWMTPVKNQGNCGGCWAFAAIAAVEAKWNIQQGNPDLDIDLSEQWLIDCAQPGLGCSAGGSFVQALDPFIKKSGVPVESCDPFVMKNTTCSTSCADSSSPKLWKIAAVNSFVPSPPDKVATRKWTRDSLVHDGPNLRHMGGPWYYSAATKSCSQLDGDHDVVVVGYDHAAGYWIVRNSWGAAWNGNGYFAVQYGECAMDAYSESIAGVVSPP